MISDGRDYEPKSLKVMQAALDRHLQEEGCSYSILKDAKFSNSYKVLNDKAIVQQENEKGKRLRKADVLTENEEEHLLCSGVLGPDPLTTLFSSFSVSTLVPKEDRYIIQSASMI